MTLLKAEYITACLIEIKDREAIAYEQDGAEYARVPKSRTASQTLSALVEAVYKLRSMEVFARAKYRCERCGRLEPLQIHHRKYRSHGRQDSASNLEAVCMKCHNLEHS